MQTNDLFNENMFPKNALKPIWENSFSLGKDLIP